ncbi:sensor histidine kinase [Nonomuraea sp. NPDC049400]|uniref:sensor histidine kinase n=1 Tax=Nonomuraea sp. NPDC049400 TaxID=3364352 RepID=UPI00378F86A1
MISVQRVRDRLRRGRTSGQDDDPIQHERTPRAVDPIQHERISGQDDDPARQERASGGNGRPSGPGGSGLGRVVEVALRPFAMALFEGDADPPPRSRRLTFRTPRRLGLLLPFRTVDLVQVADLVGAFILYGLTISAVMDWNAQAARSHVLNPILPGPVSSVFLYLSAIGTSLPVALRDRWPLAAWRVSAVLTPITIWVTGTLARSEPPYMFSLVPSYLLVLYSVGVRCDRRITLAVWTLSVLTAWIVHPNSMPLVAVVLSVVTLFGYNVRVRRSATAKLQVEELRTRQAESAQAVLEERARIARELHDVVAHHMSVIAIQAEAVPLKARGDRAQLEAGFAEIRGLSLEAIAELRQVLGVLRDQDGRADTAPQPGLDRLGELVSNASAAGLTVLVERSGPIDRLPPALGLSAYRIVQESLSNVMRHAPGATVALGVARKRGELRLWVANGPGAAPGSAPGAGQGLVGMRERAALLGGTLAAAPTEDGGFEVRATLPIRDDADDEEEASP